MRRAARIQAQASLKSGGFAHQRPAASGREIAAIVLVNAVLTASIFLAGVASIG